MTIALASLPRGGGYFINTLLQDKDGVVDDMIERYHTRSLASICCQNAAERVNRGNGTIIYNYEPLPAPKINQLVIPTGSTRWSYCLLLANDELKNLIYKVSARGTVPMNLIYGTPVGSTSEIAHIISLTVYILPPKRVSPETLDTSVNNLWIIPVVDERYWLQYAHSDDLSENLEVEATVYPDPVSPARPFTPDELLDELSTRAGLDIFNVGVNERYALLPTCASENDNENLPILMDSIYQHYGQRLVVDIACWTGTTYTHPNTSVAPAGSTRFAVIDGANSQAVLNNNYDGRLGLQACDWLAPVSQGGDSLLVTTAASGNYYVGVPKLVAGGASSSYPTTGPYASVPASVAVRSTDPEVYTPQYVSGIQATAYVSVDTQAIWRTQFEDTTDDDSPPWMTGPALNEQIARDYYFQFLHQFDFTFAGVQPWQQGYFDDFMVLRQTYNPATKGYDAYTRVCSRQPNLTGEWVTGGDGGGGSVVWAVNIGSLAPATHPLTGHTTGVAGLFTRNDPNLALSDRRRSFIRRDASGTIADGTLIQLGKVSGKWTIIWADCAAHASLKNLDPTP